MTATIRNITAGSADVYSGHRRVGSVDRTARGWVPLSLAKESLANPPQFPVFRTRQAAADALASGQVVY